MKDYKYFLDEGIYDFQCGKYTEAIEKIKKAMKEIKP